ncbi:MAG: hypothetical protein A2166_04715 [Omnitrophica WOR_2 bacterium RBG_13_41_10]|nr:MAG: hypothetical protein A2166_04715 [Omnitrophica WOR_2 bacterium RBG_13_41_10]
MKNYLNGLNRELKQLILLAQSIALEQGISAYLVGGFVRDLILKAKNLDLDIVVEGNGIKFAEEFSCRLGAKLIRHKRFATATLILRSGIKLDIASARKEFYPKPAALPQVIPGNLRDDSYRRDFSINAMAIGLSGKDAGRLIDYFHGQEDLRSKKIRILHSLSFIDDPTRILRAIRFEQRYNFKIEPDTLKNLKKAARLKMLEKTEPQRLRDELIPVLKEKTVLKQIKRLRELVGFAFINKRLLLSPKNRVLFKAAESQINWFKKTYPKRRGLDSWLIYFMALLDSLATRDIKSVCRRFAFRKGEAKRILNYKQSNRVIMGELHRSQVKPAKIFSLLEPLSYEAILLIKAKSKDKKINKYIADFFKIYNGMCISVSGDDLRKLGILPGPYYQGIFAKILQAKLNGKISTKEQELAFIKKIYRY